MLNDSHFLKYILLAECVLIALQRATHGEGPGGFDTF